MGVWPERVTSLPKVQEDILRKLARHPTDEGMPLASQPQYFLGTRTRSLRKLEEYAFVEQIGPPVWSSNPTTLRRQQKYLPWALTWRGRGYLNELDRQRRRGK